MKTKYILLILFLITSSYQSNAATKNWIGSISSSYSNSGNWSPSGVPIDSVDNIVFNSNAPNNLILTQNRVVTDFTINGDTIDLGGYQLTITGTAKFDGGLVTNGTVLPTGNLCQFSASILNVNVTAACGYFRMNGGTFNYPVTLSSTGAASTSGTGGCVFNDSLTINNTGNYYFTMGSSGKDIFSGVVNINNSGTHEVYLATGDSAFFYDNILISSTNNGGIVLGNAGGVSTLVSGKTISVGSGGFTNDYLTLKNFIQLGSTAQTLTLTSTAIVNLINCTFNGDLTVTSPGFLLKTSTFNGTSNFTRNASSTNHQSDGGNIFNGTTTFDNAGSGGRIRMATTTGDTFNGNVTFNSTGGQDVQVCYAGNSYLYGDITINSNKVVFNTSNGKVTFAGGNSQSLNGSYNFPFKNLLIDKSANQVTANTTLSVDDTLFFVSGNIVTTSSNLLTMKAGSVANGASSASFILGPIKKIGNNAFTFNVGTYSGYRPVSITAPSTTTDAFTAQYFDTTQTLGSNMDTTISFISDCGYWSLTRNTGSSNITPKFAFDSTHCDYLTVRPVHIAFWDGTKWVDKGEGVDDSNTKKTSAAVTSYGNFALAYKLIPGDAPQYPLNIQTSTTCTGMDVEFNQKEYWISFDVDSTLFKFALFSPENDSTYAPIAKLEVYDKYEVGQSQNMLTEWSFDCDSVFQTSIRKTAELDPSKQYLLKITRYMQDECLGISNSLDYFLNFCLMNIRSNPACTTLTYNSNSELKHILGDLSTSGIAANGDIVVPACSTCSNIIDLSGYSEPLTIEEGILLTGNYDLISNDINITSLNSACPSLTYQNTNASPYGITFKRELKGEMIAHELQNAGYMFFMYGKSRIQNLKLTGGQSGYQDYNEDKWLSSCIKILPGLSGKNSIQNCDISQFSYAGIFMKKTSLGTDIENSFIHRVRGSGGGKTEPKGYGIWLQGINTSTNLPEANFLNCYFDECKTAIDDQGYALNTSIDGCTFGKFFNQETINRHNNSNGTYSHPAVTMSGCPFYFQTTSNSTTIPFDIQDKVDGNYSVTGSIFYKLGYVISSPFPVGFDLMNNVIPYTFTIGNNTFSEHKDVATAFTNNFGGYARIADNYLDACVWDDDKTNGNFIISPNTHDYVPGFTAFVSNTPRPLEPVFSFSNVNGTVPGFSSLAPEVPFINQGGDFEVLVNAPGTDAVHIVRAHPSNNSAIGGANHLSGNNAYNNAENISTPSTSQVSISFSPTASGPNKFDTNKPGLYGVDVISVDASSSTYKVSQLNHKPIIVSPTSNHLLIFNIKDSYYADSYTTINLTSDVYKQVELNGQIIWREHIQLGGDDWEQVQINLFQDSYLGVPIKNYINLNGKNTITFSIGLPVPAIVSTEELRGLFVWIDDVYLKKFDSPENLIKDGDIENSTIDGLSNQPTATQLWYQKNAEDFPYYSLNYPYDPGVDPLPIPSNSNKKAGAHASVSILDRKSGTKAILLELEGIHPSNASYFPLPIDGTTNPNDEIISAAIDFDAKYFLGCAEIASLSSVQEITNSDIITGTNTFSYGTFIIKQPIEVESGETMEFLGSSVVMDATNGNVSITVKDGGWLKIEHNNTVPSRVFSCEDMWDGIIVENGGKVTIRPSGNYPTEIYDALTAIKVLGGSSNIKPLNIRYALFDHNYVGLDLSNANYYNGILTASDGLLGIDFLCSGGKIQKQPFNGLASYTHILLRDVGNINIGGVGSATAYKNTFSDAVYGVRIDKVSSSSINSIVTITNCKFDHLSEFLDSQPPSPITGCGIFAQTWSSSNTTVDISVASNFNNEFLNSQNGIILNGNITAIIKGNSFENLTQGIKLFANNNPTANSTSITINEGNNFYHVSNGITSNRVRCPIEISSNIFSNTDYDPIIPSYSPLSFRNTAVTVQSPAAITGQLVEVFNNIITNYRIGIHALNISQIKIGTPYKDIDINPPLPNIITHSTLVANQFNESIWLQNCPEAEVNDNIIENSDNSTTATYFGVELDFVSDGYLRRNLITGTSTITGSALLIRNPCDNTVLECNEMDGFDIGIQLVDGDLPTQGEADIIDPFGGTGWQNDWGTIQPLSNRVVGIPNSNNPIFWYHTGTNTSDFSPSQTNSASVSPKPNQTNGITCQSPPLRIINRDLVYGPVVGDSASYADYLSENDYQAKKRLYEKLNADTSLLTTGFGTDSAFVAFYNDAKTSNLELLSVPEKKLGILSIDSLIALNNSIIDTNVIESNKKTVNSIRLKSIADSTEYSSADTLELTDIAWQKVITGGDAVFSAREMLFLEIHEEIPVLRLSGNSLHESPTRPLRSNLNTISIYPNPTNQYLTVLKNDQLIISRIEILDVLGKNVYESTKSFQNIDVSWLVEGLYFVRIIDINQIPWHASFVKIK